MLRILLRT